MNALPALIPETRTAVCRDARRFPFAFAPRFFLALLVGLVWLGPAWLDLRFAWLMLAWDLLVLLAWWADLRRLPAAAQIAISREWQQAVTLDADSGVVLRVENRSTAPVRVEITDTVPRAWSWNPPEASVTVLPGFPDTARYTIHPLRRGDGAVGTVYARMTSALQFAERWAAADLEQTIRVYPNLQDTRKMSLYLIRSRQIQMERRFKLQPGKGREFESLREYRPGDEKRDVCWTATARRAKLVTKTYQMERSQSVFLVLDAGRLMLARAGPAGNSWTKLDCAASAALALAQVAMTSGDRTGLLVYGRKIQARLPAARGTGQFRAMLDSLAVTRGELSEAAHSHAADSLLMMQNRRGLVLWLTDLAETAATPEVIEAASRVISRHLVLFVAIGQPQLHGVVAQPPLDVSGMYRYVAAQEMLQRREVLLGTLRERGALVLDLDPSRLAPAVVNEYLNIKARGLL